MLRRKSIYFLILIFLILTVACSDNENAEKQSNTSQKEAANEELVYNPPSMDDLNPDDPLTEYITYGQEVFNETNTILPDNVGNELSCMSCHADGGLSKASSMVGVTTQFPQYRPREGVVFTIEDRINGCMVRSMNGEKLDPESKEMRAMVSYLTYISEGIEVGEEIPWRMQNTMKEIPEPSVSSGEALYAEKNCLSCHATDGSGTGTNTGPALWGENSFNDGAGMSRMSKIAGYIQNNMPPGAAEPLTDQEAADIAAFILSHERPEWKGHDTDWPNGGRPTDIITKDRREKIREGTFDWSEIDNIIPAK
ncbi:c-type cytochrome [Virgibacillus halodenitrificans]|uniref:c-type cytochrome n=1 Tax=Virgibacillus halodenitrificans TaxID=1482 RepID=UPI0024BF5B58|nr:c-type cytochrome [Virgibacillus halodenitrificans]WHX24668.1 c-type cytochrome [Virgibacillus halodenitrificans]